MGRKRKYTVFLNKNEANDILSTLKSKGLSLSYVSNLIFSERGENKSSKYIGELLKRVLNCEMGISNDEYIKLLQIVKGKYLTLSEYEELLFCKDRLERIEMMLFAPKC